MCSDTICNLTVRWVFRPNLACRRHIWTIRIQKERHAGEGFAETLASYLEERELVPADISCYHFPIQNPFRPISAVDLVSCRKTIKGKVKCACVACLFYAFFKDYDCYNYCCDNYSCNCDRVNGNSWYFTARR